MSALLFPLMIALRQAAAALVATALFSSPLTALASVATDSTVTRGQFIHQAVQTLGFQTSANCKLNYARVPSNLKADLCVLLSKNALGIWPAGKSLLLSQAITRAEALELITLLTGANENTDVSSYKDVRSSLEVRAASNAIVMKWITPLRISLFGMHKNLTGTEASTILDAISGQSEEATTDDSGSTLPNQSLLNGVWQIIQRDYLHADKVSGTDASYKSIEGLVSSLNDPYSTFFRPQEASDFQSFIKGEVKGGIGAQVESRNGIITIVTPLANSPAEKAGLKAGDEIVTVNGIPVTGMALDKAVNLIRGDKGTTVTLEINRSGSKQTFTITRDVVSIPEINVSWKGNIAIVQLAQFGDTTDNQIRSVFSEIAKKQPTAVILDLRDNPGGLLHAAVEVMSNFLPSGSDVVQVKGRNDSTIEKTNEEPTISPQTKVVVLVNKGSASASEIVAGAMEDTKRATLIGTQTFGKGTVQEVLNFNSGEALKLTVAEFFSPLGHKINGVGITPDIVLEKTATGDVQMDRALSLLR